MGIRIYGLSGDLQSSFRMSRLLEPRGHSDQLGERLPDRCSQRHLQGLFAWPIAEGFEEEVQTGRTDGDDQVLLRREVAKEGPRRHIDRGQRYLFDK